MVRVVCDFPLKGYRTTGRLVFQKPAGHSGAFVEVPCGKCIGCKLRLRSEWQIRGLCELQMQRQAGLASWFFTLTFDDQHIPADLNISLRDVQLFMMRLRKHFGPGIRVQYCGEYGGQTMRPHYHLTLWGLVLDDCVQIGRSRTGEATFTSAVVARLWGRGQVLIGEANSHTIGYVAGHQLKDLTGRHQPDGSYVLLEPSTGELRARTAPFRHQSLKPGIGASWFDKYHMDFFARGWLMRDGRKEFPPSYFLRLLRRSKPALWDSVMAAREVVVEADQFRAEHTPERLAVKAVVRSARIGQRRRADEVFKAEPTVLPVCLGSVPEPVSVVSKPRKEKRTVRALRELRDFDPVGSVLEALGCE